MHFSNDRLSRHVSVLRTVLADNDSDGKAIGLALRDADSLGKKKCSRGTDVQIDTSPRFAIKQPTFDETFPQRSLFLAHCILASAPLLPSSQATVLIPPGKALFTPALRLVFASRCAAGDQHGFWVARVGCHSPRGEEGLLSASEVGRKGSAMPTSGRERERKSCFPEYLNTLA